MPLGSRAQAQRLWRRGFIAPRPLGSSRNRDWTSVPCIARRILNCWSTRETRLSIFESSLICFLPPLRVSSPLRGPESSCFCSQPFCHVPLPLLQREHYRWSLYQLIFIKCPELIGFVVSPRSVRRAATRHVAGRAGLEQGRWVCLHPHSVTCIRASPFICPSAITGEPQALPMELTWILKKLHMQRCLVLGTQ